MRYFFKPAFALFQRTRTLSSYGIVVAALLAAQVGGIALFLYFTRGDFSAPGFARTLVLAGIGLFAFGLYMYGALALVFKRSLTAMARLLDRVGNGDLSLHFLPGWGDVSEGQRVWTALNKMNKEFPAIVRHVRATADMMATGAREVAAGYADLSSRTEKQAARARTRTRVHGDGGPAFGTGVLPFRVERGAPPA